MAPRFHPHVIVSDGTETGAMLPIGEPGERAFRAGVVFTNELFESACKIADAFALACTGPYLQKAFSAIFPGGWAKMGEDLIKGLLDQMKWVVVGAGIGATFGAGLGLLLPPAAPLTLAGGAALGAAIAQWALIGVGIVAVGKMVVQISGASIDLLGAGVREALNDNRELAANYFAHGLVLVAGAAIPLAIICALTKGAGAMIRSQTGKYMINTLTRKIGATQILTAKAAAAVGLGDIEWQAIAQSTRGIFKVFRGCNPARLEAIRRAGGFDKVHFKPGYLKDFKSAKVGQTGEYVIEAQELEKYIEGSYRRVPAGKDFRLQAIADKTKGPYLDNTSPVKGGPWLDNHLLEPIQQGGKLHYILKHPDGKTFVPDIDRLLYAEIGMMGRLGRSGVLRGKKWLANDDPREVMYWNQLISRAMSKMSGKPIDWRAIQHGKSADFLQVQAETGELGAGWPARNSQGAYLIENEPIVIGVNGNLFVTDWNGLATFAKALEVLNFKYPWAKALITEKL